MRILTIFGTRPEAIKLFPLIKALRSDTRFDCRICVTGQHRALLDQVLELTGIVPDHDLDVMQPDQSLDALAARLLEGLGPIIRAERPDAVVVQGDTTTALAGALAAYYHKVRIVHVEAGLRSGDIDQPWPEEGNRRAIGAIASLHCAPTAVAAEALVRENIDPATVHVTGNTVIDALHWVGARIVKRPELAATLAQLETRFSGRRIIAVTCHRRESFGRGIAEIADAIRRLAARPDVAVIFPVHPNPQVHQVMDERLSGLANVALIEPLDYPAFARLLSVATLLLTDSGGVQEEATALGKPVFVMRETTERHEAVAAGAARVVGTDADRIVAEAERLLDNSDEYSRMTQAHNPFGDGRSTSRIVELLANF